ncbi:MAG: sodium:solute symporter [Bacteroidia bacterium]
MSIPDWLVLAFTLSSIVIYGIYKSRNQKDIESYFLANKQLPWYHVCLSVMATQASAVTFLSAPGQAYTDGMRFVQFYFGLPLAMVVLCVTFVPVFQKLKVFTAYEFLEKRFDHKTRALTAFLFLLSRGVSTGISIYAPSIILSAILNIPISYTTILIGTLVIIYTVYGGTRAVSYTQMLQMSIIFTGILLAGIIVVKLLPGDVGFGKALHLAGKMGRMNVIDWKFDWNNRYNVWSGIIGGFFLQLSYFGTDQSQVGRYLTGSSITQSRLGLVMNGLIKIPMQFFILLTGVLVFTFYQFNKPPVFFNKSEISKIEKSEYKNEFKKLEGDYTIAFTEKKMKAEQLSTAFETKDEALISNAKNELTAADKKSSEIRQSAIQLLKKNDPGADTNDSNYIFLSFVTQYLPQGLVGLLVAVIFLASMGSLSAGLNSLASTTTVDIYMRSINKTGSAKKYLSYSRWVTVGWGIFCIISGLYASRMGNLLEAVNIIGSLFYGTILGIFLVAFYFKSITGSATFYAALITEVIIIVLWWYNVTAFLWLNVIGCLLVIAFAFIIKSLFLRTTLKNH